MQDFGLKQGGFCSSTWGVVLEQVKVRQTYFKRRERPTGFNAVLDQNTSKIRVVIIDASFRYLIFQK